MRQQRRRGGAETGGAEQRFVYSAMRTAKRNECCAELLSLTHLGSVALCTSDPRVPSSRALCSGLPWRCAWTTTNNDSSAHSASRQGPSCRPPAASSASAQARCSWHTYTAARAPGDARRASRIAVTSSITATRADEPDIPQRLSNSDCESLGTRRHGCAAPRPSCFCSNGELMQTGVRRRGAPL